MMLRGVVAAPVRDGGCAGDARVVFCAHGGDHGPPPFAAREIWSFFTGL